MRENEMIARFIHSCMELCSYCKTREVEAPEKPCKECKARETCFSLVDGSPADWDSRLKELLRETTKH